MQNTITVSEDFKKSATRSILAIILFVFVYLLLIAGSVLLIAGCYYLAYLLVLSMPSIYTLLAGVGLLITSSMIFIFLFKYLFTSQKTDRSSFIKISEKDQPEMIAFIKEIAEATGTQQPKHIYLTTEVNAFVFYNSSFWSMFLPIKKNLVIGMGLINSVTKDELKGIIAHEFGHFSQRSMKVGSYVYFVNRIIYNLLFNNNNFFETFSKWGSFHAIVAFFTMISFKIVQGIQWILRQLYKIININYLGLSREMEFHADEVAASVAGNSAMVTSLARADFSSSTFERTLMFYNNRIKSNVSCNNIYPHHNIIMKIIADKNEIQYNNDLPWLDINKANAYNKSKLVITDQWASHPATIERINKINSLPYHIPTDVTVKASSLISNIGQVQTSLTNIMFKNVTYTEGLAFLNDNEFEQAFTSELESELYPEIFNDYYSYHNPTHFDLQATIDEQINNNEVPETLFGDAILNVVYEHVGAKSDYEGLTNISTKTVDVKTFDYDGIKYKADEALTLATGLKKTVDQLAAQLAENDKKIYNYFHRLATQKGKAAELKEMYENFFLVETGYDNCIAMQNRVYQAANFMNYTLQIEEIELNIKRMRSAEQAFKKEINKVLESPLYAPVLDEEIEPYYREYANREFSYLLSNKYIEKEVTTLSVCVNNWNVVHHKAYYHHKKRLLEFTNVLLQHE